MDVTRACARVGLALIASTYLGCGTHCDVATLPATHETLHAIGCRLSRSYSERELSVISSRAELLLGQLEWGERLALAYGYLRFQVDSPVIIDVAVPVESVPFWIADQGFVATDLKLKNGDTSWSVYRKAFERGWIGLGVNGLDRKPDAHYVVFVRNREGEKANLGQPIVSLDADRSVSWRLTTAHPGVSAANDAHKPFATLPASLMDSVLIQPAHGARHSTLLATGRVWKTHIVAKAVPDQVAIAFGSDPGRELVWTWRTSADITSTAIRVRRLPKRVPCDPGEAHVGQAFQPDRTGRQAGKPDLLSCWRNRNRRSDRLFQWWVTEHVDQGPEDQVGDAA
jgi:acid phosphatase type 7